MVEDIFLFLFFFAFGFFAFGGDHNDVFLEGGGVEGGIILFEGEQSAFGGGGVGLRCENRRV